MKKMVQKIQERRDVGRGIEGKEGVSVIDRRAAEREKSAEL